ncbi:unnamed protein product, partial [Laminaria digitata]
FRVWVSGKVAGCVAFRGDLVFGKPRGEFPGATLVGGRRPRASERTALSVISAVVFGQRRRRILGICAAGRVASSVIFVMACVSGRSEVKFRAPPTWMGATLGLRGGFPLLAIPLLDIF